VLFLLLIKTHIQLLTFNLKYTIVIIGLFYFLKECYYIPFLPGCQFLFQNGVSQVFVGNDFWGIRIIWWKRAYNSPFSNFLISVEKSTP